MKKIMFVLSALLIAVVAGQSLSYAEDASGKPAKKVCKTNFVPKNRKHSEVPAAPAPKA